MFVTPAMSAPGFIDDDNIYNSKIVPEDSSFETQKMQVTGVNVKKTGFEASWVKDLKEGKHATTGT